MKKEELKKKIEEIRQLLIESDLDKATEKLTALAAQFGDAAHDEAVTINASWNDLERKMRSALIHENEARIRQNQLIDQILDFSKELEDYKKKREEPAPTKSGSKAWIYLLGGLTALIVIALLARPYFSSPDKPELTPTKKETQQAPTTTPNPESTRTTKPSDTPKKEEIPPHRNTESTKPSDTPKKEEIPPHRNTESTKPSNTPKKQEAPSPGVTPASTESIIEEKPPTAPAEVEKYKKFFSEGVYAYNRKEYEKAYELFQAALKIEVTEEVREYTRPLAENLYNKYRIKGMNFYNAGDYAAAKGEFKKAQHYKNISPIRGLIKKCDKQL